MREEVCYRYIKKDSIYVHKLALECDHADVQTDERTDDGQSNHHFILTLNNNKQNVNY